MPSAMIEPEAKWALRLFDKSILKQAKYRALLRYAGDFANQDCLDLGSDNGVISYLLRSRGGRWTSADLTAKSVASIKSLVGSNVYQIDGTTLPLADASCDLVVIIDLLEHVRDDERAIAEVHRVLRPGGSVVINTPHDLPHSLMRRVRDRVGLTDEWHGHVRPGYTLDRLRALCGDRFTIEEASSYSKFFSEALDVALNVVYLRASGGAGGDRAKGTVVTAVEVQKSARQFRLLARLYPLLWLWSRLDRLCVGARGFYLITRARKR